MKRKIISVITLSMIAVGGYCQKKSIHAVSRPAEKVFTEIMMQSGKNFVYASDLLEGLNLTVNVKEKPLETVLNLMFSSTNISYKIRGNNVILFRKERPALKKYTVSGFVRESGSKEPLPGATIRVEGSRLSTVSNAMGFYSLSVPIGEINLNVTYPGFANFKTKSFLQYFGNFL